jgi:predicted phage terminase large subunit-like protein
MTVYSEERAQRIEDCRELYWKYEGRHHELIERDMRAMGYTDFHRRVLYRRFERGRATMGWIERYGLERAAFRRGSPAGQGRGDDLRPGRAAVCWDAEDGDMGLSGDDGPAVSAKPEGGVMVDDARLTDFDEFLKWLKQVSPSMEWEWRHQVYIYKRLKRVSDGECKRLMIFLPPRHGKSELVTVRYTAFRLQQDPKLNVIIGSYNQQLANRFSRKIRRVLAEAESIKNGELRITNEEGSPPYEGRVATPLLPEEGCPKGGVVGAADGVVLSTADSESRVAERHFRSCGFGENTRQHESTQKDLTTTNPHSAFRIPQSRPVNSVAEWETLEGGGLRAVGVGGGVTGYGAGLIVVDDPVKSRAEAESQTYRDNIWDWFNDDLYTRLEPGGAIILIQTRWHEDDLAGRLLREAAEEGGEQWEVVNLPALAEGASTAETQRHEESISTSSVSVSSSKTLTTENTEDAESSDKKLPSWIGGVAAASADGVVEASPRLCVSAVQTSTDPLGRPPGEALCPQRYNEAALEKLRRKLGSYSFAALYQQRPVPAEGGLFKRAWFRTVPFAPAGIRWKRGYDLAVSTSATADYTASFRAGYDREGNLYIDGGFRRRIAYPEQRRFILGRIAAETDTEHGVELSVNGHAVIQDLRREPAAQGRAFRGVRITGDKVSRALPWIALAEEGRVFLVRGSWNTEFIDEACSFPAGTHDDQIDAVSVAIQMHRQHNKRVYGF